MGKVNKIVSIIPDKTSNINNININGFKRFSGVGIVGRCYKTLDSVPLSSDLIFLLSYVA